MKTTIITYVSLIFIATQVSCNVEQQKKDILSTMVIQNHNGGDYMINSAGIAVQWTAYKFTNKVGVSGTFSDLDCRETKYTGSIEEILKGLKLDILTTSVNTGNEVRDFKLKTYFFSEFNTPKINGTIINAKNSEGLLKLYMNNQYHRIPYTYYVENDTITVFTHLNLQEWQGKSALEMLNKQCYDLHKGEDGISKLWPDVDVTIKLPIFMRENS